MSLTVFNLGIISLIINWLTGNFPNNVVAQAFFASMIGAILTFVGALPALLGARLSMRIIDLGMGFSAGAMTVISFTGLIIPALKISSFSIIALGFTIGVIIVVLTDRLIWIPITLNGFNNSLNYGIRVLKAGPGSPEKLYVGMANPFTGMEMFRAPEVRPIIGGSIQVLHSSEDHNQGTYDIIIPVIALVSITVVGIILRKCKRSF